MISGTNPGGEIVKEPLVVSYNAPLLLDGFPLVVHAKGTAIDQNARHIEGRDEVKNLLLGPSKTVPWPLERQGPSSLTDSLGNLYKMRK